MGIKFCRYSVGGWYGVVCNSKMSLYTYIRGLFGFPDYKHDHQSQR